MRPSEIFRRMNELWAVYGDSDPDDWPDAAREELAELREASETAVALAVAVRKRRQERRLERGGFWAERPSEPAPPEDSCGCPGCVALDKTRETP